LEDITIENSKPYVACPACDAVVARQVLYRDGDVFFCPACQPELARAYAEAAKEQARERLVSAELELEESRLELEEARYEKIEAEERHSKAREKLISLRKDHIRQEASLRTAGSLYYIGSGFAVLIALGMLFWAERIQPENQLTTTAKVIIGVHLALALVGIWIGRLFRQLSPAVIKPAKFFSTIGLVAFPHGTIIHGYILHLLRSPKGKVVLSESYKKVIERSPEIKCGFSPLAWIVTLLVILTVCAFVALKVLSPAPGS